MFANSTNALALVACLIFISRFCINITSFGLDQHNELLFCGNESIYKLTSNQGDVNDDGEINILDIVSLINLILDNSYLSTADLNNDSIINVLDVVQLVNIILN